MWWVSENLCSFGIISDHRFLMLMKTGWPEYYILSPSTISYDVRFMFACTQQHIVKMLQEYKGRVSFTTDTWTSPNHHSFIAFCVHMEHEGKLLTFPLDIVEVTRVSDHDIVSIYCTHSSLVTRQAHSCNCFCKNARRVWIIRQGMRMIAYLPCIGTYHCLGSWCNMQ